MHTTKESQYSYPKVYLFNKLTDSYETLTPAFFYELFVKDHNTQTYPHLLFYKRFAGNPDDDAYTNELEQVSLTALRQDTSYAASVKAQHSDEYAYMNHPDFRNGPISRHRTHAKSKQAHQRNRHIKHHSYLKERSYQNDPDTTPWRKKNRNGKRQFAEIYADFGDYGGGKISRSWKDQNKRPRQYKTSYTSTAYSEPVTPLPLSKYLFIDDTSEYFTTNETYIVIGSGTHWLNRQEVGVWLTCNSYHPKQPTLNQLDEDYGCFVPMKAFMSLFVKAY